MDYGFQQLHRFRKEPVFMVDKIEFTIPVGFLIPENIYLLVTDFIFQKTDRNNGSVVIVQNPVFDCIQAGRLHGDLQIRAVRFHIILEKLAGAASVFTHDKFIRSQVTDMDLSFLRERMGLAYGKDKVIIDDRDGNQIGAGDDPLHQGDIKLGIEQFLLNQAGIADTGVNVEIGQCYFEVVDNAGQKAGAYGDSRAEPQIVARTAVLHVSFQQVVLAEDFPGMGQKLPA